ncbi:unnamed protein product [Prorocentrum cordatum]|uniref:Uncharacterized protein n=1 Tax=Prorocentrum cordatum TaxID=2364126 RepID=A0ABN9SVF0_9DINO|nr:unnamed protein product [Polarella glacialis]
MPRPRGVALARRRRRGAGVPSSASAAPRGTAAAGAMSAQLAPALPLSPRLRARASTLPLDLGSSHGASWQRPPAHGSRVAALASGLQASGDARVPGGSEPSSESSHAASQVQSRGSLKGGLRHEAKEGGRREVRFSMSAVDLARASSKRAERAAEWAEPERRGSLSLAGDGLLRRCHWGCGAARDLCPHGPEGACGAAAQWAEDAFASARRAAGSLRWGQVRRQLAEVPQQVMDSPTNVVMAVLVLATRERR